MNVSAGQRTCAPSSRTTPADSAGRWRAPTYHGRDEEWLITPAFTVVRVTDAVNAGTGLVKVRYPDGSEWWMVTIFELKDDLLYRQSSFFAAPFEAPEWRSQWVETDHLMVTPRDLLGRLYDAFNRRDYDAAMQLLHLEFIEEWPQSGERVRGADNLRAILENYPGGVSLDPAEYHGKDEEWLITPGYTVVRVTDAGNAGTGLIKIRYADGSEWWMVILFELKDDLLYRQTTFFAAPFEAPEWRAQWVERMTASGRQIPRSRPGRRAEGPSPRTSRVPAWDR